MSRYKLKNKGVGVDRIHTHAYESVDDITARDAIDVTNDRVAVGKVIYIKDIGDGTSAMQEWNGSAWVAHVFDEIVVGNDSIIKTEDGNLTMEITSSGDDRGWKLDGGQFEVCCSEIVAGNDSYPVELAFHYDVANESSGVITGAIDRTVIFASDSGSNAGLFNANTTGQVLVIASDDPYFGAKMKYADLGGLQPQNVLGEYLNGSGDWIERSFMVTNANGVESVGWELASFTQEHVRFGQSLSPNAVNDFLPQTLTINGTVYEDKYWARLRLLSPLTQMPQVEQIKHNPSKIELNSGSTLEFFGRSMSSFTLQAGIRNLINNPESSPANENINYMNSSIDGDGLTVQGLDNEFDNGTVDSSMIVQSFVETLDTSTPLLLTLSYHPTNDATGQLEFVADYIQVANGYEYNQNDTPDGTVKVTDIIPSNSDNIRRTVTMEIPINRVGTEGGGVVIGLQRDSRPSNTEDTYEGDIIVTNFRLDGRRWRV